MFWLAMVSNTCDKTTRRLKRNSLPGVLVSDGKVTRARRRLKRNSLQGVLVSDGKVTIARRRRKRNSLQVFWSAMVR